MPDLISSMGSIFSKTAAVARFCSFEMSDDEVFAVCEMISDVLDNKSAVSCNVSEISRVEALDKFFSEMAFFSVAAV